jgi:molybdenum cofactor cytidylyltransferase
VDDGVIAAVVLAAGRSVRMGRPKLLLPLADGRSMLAHVVGLLKAGGAEPVLVVMSPEEGVADEADRVGARAVRLGAPLPGEMIGSLQRGLEAAEKTPAEAALILPGDMPFVQPATIRSILDLWLLERPPVLVPSFQNRRGHPVCLARETWADIQALQPPTSLRDYLRRHGDGIRYLVVEDAGVLEDVDAPEDYDRAMGRGQT